MGVESTCRRHDIDRTPTKGLLLPPSYCFGVHGGPPAGEADHADCLRLKPCAQSIEAGDAVVEGQLLAVVEPDPNQLLRVGVGVAFKRARLKYVYSILRGKDLETEQFSEDRRDEQFSVL